MPPIMWFVSWRGPHAIARAITIALANGHHRSPHKNVVDNCPSAETVIYRVRVLDNLDSFALNCKLCQAHSNGDLAI